MCDPLVPLMDHSPLLGLHPYMIDSLKDFISLSFFYFLLSAKVLQAFLICWGFTIALLRLLRLQK